MSINLQFVIKFWNVVFAVATLFAALRVVVKLMTSYDCADFANLVVILADALFAGHCAWRRHQSWGDLIDVRKAKHSVFVIVNGLVSCVGRSHLVNLLLNEVTKGQLAATGERKLDQISRIDTFGSVDFFMPSPDNFAEIIPEDFDFSRFVGFWRQKALVGLVSAFAWQRRWLCFLSNDEMSISDFVEVFMMLTCRLHSFLSLPTFDSAFGSHNSLICCFGSQRALLQTEPLMTKQEFWTKRIFTNQWWLERLWFD